MQSHTQTYPKYVCPQTRAPLRLDGDVLRATAGDTVYQIQSGIPQFLRFEPAEDEQTKARLDRLNRLAHDEGWRAALQSTCGEEPSSSAFRYVTDEARASFIDLLPLTNQSEVLEIGSSLGQITVLLARRVRAVCALEVVPGQAQFAAERCREEGVSNVHFCRRGR